MCATYRNTVDLFFRQQSINQGFEAFFGAGCSNGDRALFFLCMLRYATEIQYPKYLLINPL